MRFLATISTQEDRYDTITAECISTDEEITGYEMESIQCTVQLKPRGRKMSSAPVLRRRSGLKMSGGMTSSRSRKKHDQIFTEEEELELCRIGLGAGSGGGSSEKQREEEELRKKMMKKPSRKVSREGDHMLIQEITGCKMTQTGSQQIREERVLIGSDEYLFMLKQGLLRTTNGLD